MRYLRTSGLAKAVGVHANTVRRYVDRGILPPVEQSRLLGSVELPFSFGQNCKLGHLLFDEASRNFSASPGNGSRPLVVHHHC
jgi:hypothetical protein